MTSDGIVTGSNRPQMQVKIRGHRTIDAIRKRDEFPMPVMVFVPGNNFAGGGIQNCERRRCAMADTIMRDVLST